MGLSLPVPAVTIGLLVASNLFMTLAWYGHLKFKTAPLVTVIGALSAVEAGGLSPAHERGLVVEALDEARARFGLALLMVEHDIETISGLCSRAVVLSFGQLIADGTPDEVFRDPAVMESYTGAAHA